MSEVKLEVGQILKCYDINPSTIEILKVFPARNMVIFYWFDSIGRWGCRKESFDWINNYYELFKNADRTPAEKPKKYKELTPVEAMRLLAEAGESIECEVSNDRKWWDEVQLFGAEFISEHKFHTSNDVYKYCRIEVNND